MRQIRNCPDCEVEMEKATVTAGGYSMNIKSEREEGLLSKIGIDKNIPVQQYICPNCRLVRFYASDSD